MCRESDFVHTYSNFIVRWNKMTPETSSTSFTRFTTLSSIIQSYAVGRQCALLLINDPSQLMNWRWINQGWIPTIVRRRWCAQRITIRGVVKLAIQMELQRIRGALSLVIPDFKSRRVAAGSTAPFTLLSAATKKILTEFTAANISQRIGLIHFSKHKNLFHKNVMAWYRNARRS